MQAVIGLIVEEVQRRPKPRMIDTQTEFLIDAAGKVMACVLLESHDAQPCLEVDFHGDRVDISWERGAATPQAFTMAIDLIDTRPTADLYVVNGAPMFSRDRAITALRRLSED